MIADATVDVDPNSTSKKSSWPSAPGFTLDSLGKVGKLSPNLSRKPCITWHRPLYWLDFPIPDVPAEDANRPSLLSHAQTMRDADPAPRPQLAFPVSCITAAAAVRFQNGATLKQQVVADLISVAFFFLLRVGEYTMPTGNRRTCTVQFRCQDVRLWRLGQLLDHTAPLEHLLQADGVTLAPH